MTSRCWFCFALRSWLLHRRMTISRKKCRWGKVKVKCLLGSFLHSILMWIFSNCSLKDRFSLLSLILTMHMREIKWLTIWPFTLLHTIEHFSKKMQKDDTSDNTFTAFFPLLSIQYTMSVYCPIWSVGIIAVIKIFIYLCIPSSRLQVFYCITRRFNQKSVCPFEFDGILPLSLKYNLISDIH